ncbi:MAG: PilX N-terminal domain-containing pilus assembly protein, partial [Gammaproteobacteria bacterium]
MIEPRTRRKDRQSGAALIVGLVLMMVLTILAISTMRTSTLELAMAGNTQYREKARQLAEAGLADALDRIERGDYVPAEADNPDPTEEPPWSAVPV